jgi:hypothetical protein
LHSSTWDKACIELLFCSVKLTEYMVMMYLLKEKKGQYSKVYGLGFLSHNLWFNSLIILYIKNSVRKRWHRLSTKNHSNNHSCQRQNNRHDLIVILLLIYMGALVTRFVLPTAPLPGLPNEASITFTTSQPLSFTLLEQSFTCSFKP